MTHEQIKIIVHYEREKKFPYDTQYLYNMSNITVAPDCVSYIGFGGFDESVKIINPEKGYREERYLIFTCVPQIKHFAGATEIYIDCSDTTSKGTNPTVAIDLGYKFIYYSFVEFYEI